MTTLVEPVITTAEEDTALNLQQLYALGLQSVRDLSKRIWTDYNVHDPGITTLEVICYALTDLGYRASLPVADLLASELDNAASMAAQFFTARQILPNRALTVADYRKLLIDLRGVKNAWLQPAALTYYADLPHARILAQDPGTPGIEPVAIHGLYQVLIDFMDDLNQQQKDETLTSVRSTLHANRNLCEDFVAIGEVDTEDFVACGELEIEPGADATAINASLLFQLQRHLAPAVSNYRLAEMLVKTRRDGSSYTADEIFNGPALSAGFIPDEELDDAELKTEIRLSDVINIAMDIPGVRAIRELVINRSGETVPLDYKWLVPVSAGRKARLDISGCRLIFYKRHLPILPDAARVAQQYQALLDAERKKLETDAPDDFAIPLGKFRDPASYYALQNHFPAVYGLGETGLPANADTGRRAKALQLRGYLLFFEQLLANFCAQLSHVRDLFSADPALERTYFYQVVDSFSDWQKVYGSADPVADMENQVEDKAAISDRRQRFLDHLIGRFAEQFSDFAHIMYSAFSVSPSQLRQYKCGFLQHYPAISSERGLAYNYSLKTDADLWNSANISGLERRLAFLLGIRNYSRRNLSEIPHDIYAEVDQTPDDEFRFRVRHRVSGNILLSSSTRYVTEADARAEMYLAISAASSQAGYERKIAGNGRHYFNIVDGTGEVLARRIEYFDLPETMEAAIDELLDYLQTHYNDEGMYLIENLLLRPEQDSDPMLPICVDSNCAECSELDPYSYRIHIVLPAYGARFSNMEFRRFAESVIRAEVPAHILPKICWISATDMAALEGAYRAWISIRSGRTTANRTSILQAFIERLYAVKNVYPSEQLGDCSAARKFVLDHSALGSMSAADDDGQ